MNKLTRQELINLYQKIRRKTEALCWPLEIEDYLMQSIPDVSPPKWHLAHTAWFFETFILLPHLAKYQPFHPSFHHLFNSYYQSLGNPYPRLQRGLLSRPTVKTIYAYRNHVDQCLLDFIHKASDETISAITTLLILGLHHEQQHQELLLMDIKHNFSIQPDFPIYHQANTSQATLSSSKMEFQLIEGGITKIGYQGNAFCFDNELPSHELLLKSFLMASRLVTNEEYLEFITAGGYQQPDWWLADGWECVQRNHWHAPLYWHHLNNQWHIFTLTGLQPLNPHEPVLHVSYFEADAYARWRGLRLPLEAEWEHYVTLQNISAENANFLEAQHYHPRVAGDQQLFGDAWEWTASSYMPYPGYQPLMGALGEYNGKFMSNQMVLRGGSCVTPQSHIRASYRNFFQPDKRWQFSGIRLAKNC